jgi:poly(A) polymerase
LHRNMDGIDDEISLSPDTNLAFYAGRWVACLRNRIVGQGGTPQQALLAAKAARHKETPQVFYVPSNSPLRFSPMLDRVGAFLPPDIPVYLVGGTVRDALLNKPSHDYDFALPGGALQVARRVADGLGAAFFPLDEARQTGRIVLTDEEGSRHILDFASFRGDDLESDLRARDFTINAMAIDMHAPPALLDPLGGAVDLRTKILRGCGPTTFKDDPVRIIRAIRFAAALSLQITPETRQQMRDAVPLLTQISPERLRDELMRILGGPRPHTAVRALEMLGVLPYLLPELPSLKGLTQSAPHIKDAWEHTLDSLQYLERILQVLGPRHDPDTSATLFLGAMVMRLGRYRQQIHAHLETPMVPERSLRSLLYLAALYHDIGKPDTRKLDDNGRIRFFDHDQVGARIAAKRALSLHLSNVEIQRVETIVRHHMRPMLLAHADQKPSKRAIYRFFRDTGLAGVDICLLSLADLWASYGNTMPQERWEDQIDVVRSLLEAWWERSEEQVSPPLLINGHDLMSTFGLESGPMIGKLLELVREAQAMGQVQERDEAITLVREVLDEGI